MILTQYSSTELYHSGPLDVPLGIFKCTTIKRSRLYVNRIKISPNPFVRILALIISVTMEPGMHVFYAPTENKARCIMHCPAANVNMRRIAITLPNRAVIMPKQ